jgi:hypothetical protein
MDERCGSDEGQQGVVEPGNTSPCNKDSCRLASSNPRWLVLIKDSTSNIIILELISLLKCLEVDFWYHWAQQSKRAGLVSSEYSRKKFKPRVSVCLLCSHVSNRKSVPLLNATN